MIFIDSRQDMTGSCPFLPSSGARFLEDFFDQLRELLGQDGMDETFRLSGHGYALIVLEPGEGLTSRQMERQSVDVEYAERVSLDDCQLFKVCLLEENESLTFLFSTVGSQPGETEAWFTDLLSGGTDL